MPATTPCRRASVSFSDTKREDPTGFKNLWGLNIFSHLKKDLNLLYKISDNHNLLPVHSAFNVFLIFLIQ